MSSQMFSQVLQKRFLPNSIDQPYSDGTIGSKHVGHVVVMPDEDEAAQHKLTAGCQTRNTAPISWASAPGSPN